METLGASLPSMGRRGPALSMGPGAPGSEPSTGTLPKDANAFTRPLPRAGGGIIAGGRLFRRRLFNMLLSIDSIWL